MKKIISPIQGSPGAKVKTSKISLAFNEYLIGISKIGKTVPQEFIEAILRLKPESIKKSEIRGNEAHVFLKQSVVIFDRKI